MLKPLVALFIMKLYTRACTSVKIITDGYLRAVMFEYNLSELLRIFVLIFRILPCL